MTTPGGSRQALSYFYTDMRDASREQVTMAERTVEIWGLVPEVCRERAADYLSTVNVGGISVLKLVSAGETGKSLLEETCSQAEDSIYCKYEAS